ncbi:MAG: hypothetical protein SF187_16425 [Deltaproteobacteria bacterium]|nr:hypothetical protein [Deltaproteobacteria bacterium]
MSATEETAFDPTTRRLCPDGACTGVLDESGWCAECRRTFVNAPTVASLGPETNLAPEAGEVVFSASADDSSELSGLDPSRRLCPDGACTGLLDAQGRCSECGRTAAETEGL